MARGSQPTEFADTIGVWYEGSTQRQAQRNGPVLDCNATVTGYCSPMPYFRRPTDLSRSGGPIDVPRAPWQSVVETKGRGDVD